MKVEKSPYRKTLLDYFGLSEVNHKKRKGYLLALILLKNGYLLIETLVEEMKPVVAVKDIFACRDKSKVITYFGIFGFSRI